MTSIKDLDMEIKTLEAKLEAARQARKEEEIRFQKEQEAKTQTQTKAAELINTGVEYIKKGFSYIMPSEDVEFLSETFLNESIIPLCCTLVKMGKNPLIKDLFNFVDNDKSKEEPIELSKIKTNHIDIDDVINHFLISIGE